MLFFRWAQSKGWCSLTDGCPGTRLTIYIRNLKKSSVCSRGPPWVCGVFRIAGRLPSWKLCSCSEQEATISLLPANCEPYVIKALENIRTKSYGWPANLASHAIGGERQLPGDTTASLIPNGRKWKGYSEGMAAR